MSTNNIFAGKGVRTTFINILYERSYYLQQYVENVCSKIEDAANQAGAKSAEVIYNSGGKFYLLTDNSEAIRKFRKVANFSAVFFADSQTFRNFAPSSFRGPACGRDCLRVETYI